MISSFSTWPPISPTVVGMAGSIGWAMGIRHRDNSSAKDSRIRAGTKASPMPGSSMTTAPTRMNTRPAA